MFHRFLRIGRLVVWPPVCRSVDGPRPRTKPKEFCFVKLHLIFGMQEGTALENSVNIWNLLWLSRRLIICTEQTSIFISTFSNTLTPEWAKNHEISICFSTNVRSSMSRTAITLKFKMSRLLEKRKTTTTTTTTTKGKEN